MPAIIHHLLLPIAIGFLIGASLGTAFLACFAPIPELAFGTFGSLLILYAFGSSFGLGYLATGKF